MPHQTTNTIDCSKRVADAMIYFDIKGFTRYIDSFQTDEHYLHLAACWQDLRDELLCANSPHGRGIYVANRIGDACLLFCFDVPSAQLLCYVTGDLQRLFERFLAHLAEGPAGGPTPRHVKLSIIGGGCPYYQTGRVPREIVGDHSWSLLDFFSPTINKLARIDALPEADDFVFLCNAWLRDELVGGGLAKASTFIDLGLRPLKGFSAAEWIFGYMPNPPGN
ncbi:MAG: hypothetical protein JRH20_28475 [Deltaproteobacteria bacterium]|nr:hypothetical protein [Deltaproteobacteria bacterium]